MRRALVVLIALASLRVAHAEGKVAPWSAGVTEAAKAAATRKLDAGNQLFLDKKFGEALAVYREAVAAWDHPAIRFNIVRCLIQLDRPVEAAENLAQALRYGAEPLEAAVYTEALAYEKLLAKQVGSLEIACTQAGVDVTLDGQRIRTCPFTEQRQIAPGRHQVLATHAGFVPVTREVVIIGGERQRIALPSLARIGAGGTRGISARAVGKVTALAGTGLVAIAGGLAGWAYLRYHAELDDHCTPTEGRPACTPAGVAGIDRARTFGTAATIVGAVGGAALVTGVIILLRAGGGERTPALVPASQGTGVAISGVF